jgi:sugar phosphate isomerase/epimerase
MISHPGRRDFLSACGAALGAALLPARRVRAEPAPAALGGIGVQLYTVRRELERDFDGTLARVAEIGFREVEFAGYMGRPPARVRAALERHRLAAPASHVAFEAVADGTIARTLGEAAEAGHRWIVVPWLPTEARGSLDAWRRTAELLARAGERARRAGLRLAYHNHDFELPPVDGRVPLELLLDETDPTVDFELDLFWLVRGGGDPLEWFARYPGRFPLVHAKDSAGAPEHRMVDVGAGTLDFARILGDEARQKAGIEHVFVEHDEPANAFATIRAGYEHLRRALRQGARPS